MSISAIQKNEKGETNGESYFALLLNKRSDGTFGSRSCLLFPAALNFRRLVSVVFVGPFDVTFYGSYGGGGSQGQAGESNPGETLELPELPEDDTHAAMMGILCGYIDFEEIGNYYYAEVHGLGMYVKSSEEFTAFSYGLGDVCISIPSNGRTAYECSEIFMAAFNDAVQQVIYYVDTNVIEPTEGDVISNLSSEIHNKLILYGDLNASMNRQSCYENAPITDASYCANE